MKAFEDRAKFLIQKVYHRNLVRYTSMRCTIYYDTFYVILEQEYVNGMSIKSICENGELPNVPAVAKNVLLAIKYLHNMNPEITHDYLKSESIFLEDGSAVIRVADYDLIPYLMYLNGNHDIHKINDFNALGLLVQSFDEIISKSTADFVDKCCSGRVLNHSQLFQHSFLSNDWVKNRATFHGSAVLKDFEIEKWLGGGSFGKWNFVRKKNFQSLTNYWYKLTLIIFIHFFSSTE